MTIIIPVKRKFAAPPLVRTIDDRRDPLNLGLVGHWTLDAETVNGTRVLDLSGGDHHGTLNSTTNISIVPGKVGQALKFNGVSFPQLDINGTVCDPGSGFISFSVWVNPSSTVNGSVISQLFSGIYAVNLTVNEDSAGANNIGYWSFALLNSAATSFLIADVRSNVVPGNAWTHLCGVRTGPNTLALYRNGVVDASTMRNTDIVTVPPLNALCLGRRVDDAGHQFIGAMDDVRVYNRALTPAEVFQLYADPARDRAPYQTRGRVKGPTGAASITGTLAVTEANDTIAAVGRVAVGGTLAVTEQADTINAAGAVRVAGTLASTEQPDTLAATGTVAALGAITGTLSAFQAVQTLIAAGQIRVSGGLNVSQAAQTLAASGIVGSIVPPPSEQSVQVIIMS